MKKWLLLTLLPLSIHATELAPWYGRDLEPHFRAEYLFQNFAAQNDHFLNLSVEGAYTNWQAEAELLLADTRANNSVLDSFKLTGRYQWLSDIVGDSFTLTTGLSFSSATTHAVRDYSSFHHGLFEGELHLALGKEFVGFRFWEHRIWGVFGVGMANQGSPWLRGELAWERNWWDWKSVRLFVNTLWGLGDHSANFHDFSGYGPIDHASIDVGARFTLQTESWGQFALQYSRRVHARNFPHHTNRASLHFNYPFWF